MTVLVRKLPVVPRGVDVTDLKANFKLYSDDEMREIKSRFTANGRYREYVSESTGQPVRLPCPVFVFDGRYFAAYPGKKFLLGKSNLASVKLAQDFDSGAWVTEKVLRVDFDNDKDFFRDDIENESYCQAANQQAIMANDTERAVKFYRPFDDIVDADSEEGKYYLFSQYASGMDIGAWVERFRDMPRIIRLDVAISLVNALMGVHEQQVVHRDMKPANAVFDMFKAFNRAVAIIDFGLSVRMEELGSELTAGWGTPPFEAPEIRKTDTQDVGMYSVKSDIYALGVTLGVVCGCMEMTPTGDVIRQLSLARKDDLEAKLQGIVDAMVADDAEKRPALNAVLEELHTVRSELRDEDRVLNVCMLDVEKFIAARQGGDKSLAALLSDLQNFHIIRLCVNSDAAHEYDDFALLQIKSELQARGCVVAEDIYQGTQEELNAFAGSRENHESADGRIYQLHYMTHEVKNEEREAMDEVEDVVVIEEVEQENEFLLPDEPRPGQRVFTHIAMHDEVVSAGNHANEVEQYDLGDLLCSVLDAAGATVSSAALSFLQCGSSGTGCFGFFARTPNSDRQRLPTDGNVFEAAVGSDSDAEESVSPRAMARY